MRRLCIYHSADLDGHCSGAIVRKKYPDVELVGMNYDDPVDEGYLFSYDEVIIVDFSLPQEIMAPLAGFGKLTWIDHHKTAIERAIGTTVEQARGRREIGLAGCELTWLHYFGHPTPEAVRLLGRYDVWDHGNPSVLPFQYGARLYDTWPGNDGFWSQLLGGPFLSPFGHCVLSEGKTVLRYQEQENRKYAKSYAFETTLQGHTVIAVNRRLTNSKIFDSVFDPIRHSAMMSFGWQAGKWCVSLYAPEGGIDVSAIAKRFGGGGHAGAAGFSCVALPFDLK